MAKYIGSLTADARGKLGGFVMTRASNGTNLKAHAVPIQPRSGYQTLNRSTFGNAISAWRNLTDNNRTTWAILAAQYVWLNSLAQTYSPTGLQLWTQAYCNAANFDSLPPGFAPSGKPFIEPISSIAIATDSGVMTVTCENASDDYNGYYFCSLSSIINVTRNYTKGIRRRPMGAVLDGSVLTCTTAYERAYGLLPVGGSTLSARVVPVDPNSFISSTPLALNVTVT